MTVSLTESQRRLLLAVAQGFRLKDHRDIEGNKRYVLHDPSDNGEEVSAEDVHALVDLGLLSSNKKFPAATYWLTEAGQRLVVQMR
ncbi:MAG: hypothetical protein RML84_10845 [Anaerolineae bacterium]|nr:hypothetical protein [Thermoflexales bacterium]MDW8293578.1 hypothetical protein [Anaerolineae bacterium]